MQFVSRKLKTTECAEQAGEKKALRFIIVTRKFGRIIRNGAPPFGRDKLRRAERRPV